MSKPPVCRTVLGLALAALAFLPLLTVWAGGEKEKVRVFTKEELAFFDKQVKPILDAHCLKCHSPTKARGGLRLHTRETALKGGDLGPAVSLQKPHESALLKAINYKEGLEMPPTGKLLPRDIDVLTRWVHMGLPYPPSAGGTEIAKTPEEGGKVTPESKQYWAYKSVKRPKVPVVKNTVWVRNPLDAFVLHPVEEKGLSPAPPADRVALVRRVYYDLIGLPPTPEQVDEFVKDGSPKAYENLLDRLLASPHYGEKWARHWLDLVRYAESHGYERDSYKPFAWRYRDYVIDSFNKDKPYDRFLLEQLAGDELDEVTPETMTATGYYRLGLWDDEPADRLLAKYDILDGIVSTTGSVVLGMSVGCARCHDHKRDPLPQKDYYRLLAFFHDVSDMNRTNTRRIANEADRRALQERAKQKALREAELYQQVYNLEQQLAVALAKKGEGSSRASSDLVDLSYRFYRDTWESLPDFDSLKAETSGPVASNRLSLAPASRQEAIGLVFTGKLKVPAKGSYLFHLESADGVRLTIDGKTVLDKPTRGTHRTEARAELAAGLLPFRLEYFNTVGKPLLKLSWSGPGLLRRDLTESSPEQVFVRDSREEGTVWACAFHNPGPGWTTPPGSGAPAASAHGRSPAPWSAPSGRRKGSGCGGTSSREAPPPGWRWTCTTTMTARSTSTACGSTRRRAPVPPTRASPCPPRQRRRSARAATSWRSTAGRRPAGSTSTWAWLRRLVRRSPSQCESTGWSCWAPRSLPATKRYCANWTGAGPRPCRRWVRR
jgi:hypothetical protein